MTRTTTDKKINIICASSKTIALLRRISEHKAQIETKQMPTNKTSHATKPKHQSQNALHPDIIICCKACRNILTKDEFSLSINGYHEHIQCNPYGHTFVFRCFNEVWNVSTKGEPQSEASWFNGYQWTLTQCSQCQSHLGWYFSNALDQHFWGLISERLFTQRMQS